MGQKTLTVFNAHIDPHAETDDQLEQHKAIIAVAQKVDGPTVLLGDFNTLTRESRVRMRGLLESHGYTTPFRDGVATWRAGLIRLQPDWIFVRDAHVLRLGVARRLRVSDHWPVWVELDLDPLALAICGASTPQDQKLIDALLAEHGSDGFPAAFLAAKGFTEEAGTIERAMQADMIVSHHTFEEPQGSLFPEKLGDGTTPEEKTHEE